ncbi:MAG: FMN-binding protein [FCB group bacterium]|nr:FMN-binding protein [FCB group bacterium]MBL7028913.1 FMN-binding protein [Candidatus Neomarinimicrobiota bacterium]MBL7122751.1 FMN-binding protein [Candidatus Neomarinimicrobiota bacterium]
MLEKTGRRWLRVIHIVFIASLMGGLASILAIHAIPGLDTRQLFIANYSIYTLFNMVVTWSFYGVVATGLVYSVFTHWGLTKHWWIIGKWTGTVMLFALVWIWLGPAINGMVALSDIGMKESSVPHDYTEYHNTLTPVIAIAMLIMFTLISITIFRPWGQRSQKYEMRRGMVLTLTVIGVVLGVGLGLIGYFDLESYRNMEIGNPDLTLVPDGIHRGSVSYSGFEYTVAVKVSESMIVGIGIVQNRGSEYARFAEAIIPRVIKQQTPNVDGITGATTTSKCLMKAVETALEGAK